VSRVSTPEARSLRALIFDFDHTLTDLGRWVNWKGARDEGGCLTNTLKLAAACRKAGMPFVWLRYDRFIGEKEPANEMDRVQYHFWNKEYAGDRAKKDWECDLVPEVKAILQKGDMNLVYPGWSIFTGTGLWKLLTPVRRLAVMIPWAGQVPEVFLDAILVVERARVWEHAVLHAREEDDRELEALHRMQRDERRDGLGLGELVLVRHERDLFEERGQLLFLREREELLAEAAQLEHVGVPLLPLLGAIL